VLALYPVLQPGWLLLPEVQRLPMRLGFAAAQWGGIVAAFGFARRHLDVDYRWRAPLTEAVFPLYLVHQTVLIVAAVALCGYMAWVLRRMSREAGVTPAASR
jgi:hypothetical protein